MLFGLCMPFSLITSLFSVLTKIDYVRWLLLLKIRHVTLCSQYQRTKIRTIASRIFIPLSACIREVATFLKFSYIRAYIWSIFTTSNTRTQSHFSHIDSKIPKAFHFTLLISHSDKEIITFPLS